MNNKHTYLICQSYFNKNEATTTKVLFIVFQSRIYGQERQNICVCYLSM